jgi:hypothetical protein
MAATMAARHPNPWFLDERKSRSTLASLAAKPPEIRSALWTRNDRCLILEAAYATSHDLPGRRRRFRENVPFRLLALSQKG